tara:strand:- start:1927 stop:2169 length:243 start_codon:yes stop_codon:yes gene_type:complete
MGEWYAFYSKEAESVMREINDKNNTTITNLYKLKNSSNLVETTAVFSVNDSESPESCNYNFSDAVYLGIVDEWIRTGKKK